jgi:uncharacterized RDD family membrane protein YckC
MLNTKHLHLFDKKIIFQKLHLKQIKIRRVLAAVIDILLIIGALTSTLILLKVFKVSTDGLIYYGFWLYIFYYGIQLSYKNSATVGMKITKIKVVDRSGNNIKALACFTLPFATIIGLFPLLLSIENFQKVGSSQEPILLLLLIIYFMPFMNSRKRTYQDSLAGVVFIRSDYKSFDSA